MKSISELRTLFDEIIRLKNKAKLNAAQFCSELIASDDEEYLELHYLFLRQKKRYAQSYLKMYFGFRQDKEKTHHFLKNKLQHQQDQQLIADINEILEDLKVYDLADMENWFEDLKSGKRSDKNEFVWAINGSPHVELHYDAMFDEKIDAGFKRHLQSEFDEHKDAGEEFLLNKLETGVDENKLPAIIFILGHIAGKQKAKSLEYARKFAESENVALRDRALIVLGWLGTIDDTKILTEHLLNDENAKCRAWSAASFMQMWFRRKSESLKQRAFQAFGESLTQEKDLFVIATIIDSIREIGETKLGISQKAIDELDEEKILIAKEKAIKFLGK